LISLLTAFYLTKILTNRIIKTWNLEKIK
jgi:hypothetical protein